MNCQQVIRALRCSISLQDFRSMVQSQLKEAMRSNQKVRLNVLRSILSELTYANKTAAFTNKRSANASMSPASISDINHLPILQKMANKHRDSIRLFEEAKRVDLVEKEAKELEILLSFLPQQKSVSEIEDIVRKVLTEVEGPKSLGKVMKLLQTRLDPNTAPGNVVAEVVKSCLKSLQ